MQPADGSCRLQVPLPRLQILQARMRQSEARRAMGKVMRGVESTNLYGELDRLGERVERRAAEEAACLKLGAEVSGDDLKRRFEAAAIDDAADDRLQRLKASLEAEAAEGAS